MKKVYYLLLIILGIFLCTDVLALSVEHNMGKGQEISLDFYDYSGVSCDDTELYYLKYTSISAESGVVSYKLSDYPERDNYSERMVCTYDYELYNPASGPGRLEYTFYITPAEITLDFDLIKNKFDSVNLFVSVDYYDEFTELVPDLKKVISLKANSAMSRAANSYITTDCPANSTTKCNFKLKSSFPESYTEGKEANYILNYENDTGDFMKMYINITAYPSMYLYANYGGYGVCSFGSGWINSENDFEKKHKQVVGDTITLPRCDASRSKNPFLEFVGWVDISGGKGGADATATDLCASYVLPSNTVTVTDETRDFITCYKKNNGIILNLNGGTFALPSGTTEVDGLHYIKSSSRVTLPRVTKVPAVYKVGSEEGIFVGWEDEYGGMYDAGESVDADTQLYSAVFSEKNVEVKEELLYTKLVYYHTHESIQVSGTIDTCTSTNTSYVTTTISNNECIIHGEKATGESLINVLVKLTDDTTITYKVRVEEAESELQFDEVVDLSPLENYDSLELEATSVDIYGTSSCSSYKVKQDSVINDDIAKNKIHYSDNLRVLKYEAVSHCDSSDKHLALCMDPGKYGPGTGGVNYQLDTSFNADSEFGKMLKHIVTVLSANNKTEPYISAANIALRTIQYYADTELGGYNGYYNHMVAYKDLGKTLTSSTYCGNNLANCSKAKIQGALTTAWDWHDTDVYNKVVDMFFSYDGTTVAASALNGITAHSELKEMNAYGSDGVQMVFDGYATFSNRSQMSGVEISAFCPQGTSCAINRRYTYQSGNRWYFRYELYVTAANAAKFNDATVSPAVEFTLRNGSVTAANVFVLKPVDGKFQRMAIFNLEKAKVRVNLQSTKSCSVLRSYVGRFNNWRVPQVLNPESSSFNGAVFKALGCCDIISGVARYEDQYDLYCSTYCFSNNFELYCKPSWTAGDHQGGELNYDTYSLKEAYVGSVRNSKQNFACVVDVTYNATTSKNKTKTKVDYEGNKHTVQATASNPYCVVSCREEWDISMPSFNSFTDKYAVLAGSYFYISQPIFIGTKKQCYTSYIDYSAYVQQQQNISKDMITNFNIHSEFTKVYESMNKSSNKKTRRVTYYTWHKRRAIPCHSGTHCRSWTTRCSTNSEGVTTCRDVCTYRSACRAYDPADDHTCWEWYSKSHTCTLYQVSKDSSPSFNAYTYSSWNKNDGGWGDSLIKDGSATYGARYASGRLSSGTSNVVNNGNNTLESKYVAGSRAPSKHVQSSAAYDGKCCGSSPYNCSTYDWDDIIRYANYRSSNYSASGNIISTISSKKNSISSAVYNLKLNAQNMAKCQNFNLVTDTSDSAYSFNNYTVSFGNAYNNKNSGKLFSKKIVDSAPTQSIVTTFEPKASYEYEEYFYMNQLAKDNGANVIRPLKSTEDFNEFHISIPAQGSCVDAVGRKSAYYFGGNREQLQLCRQKRTTAAYNPNQYNKWTNEDEGRYYADTSSAVTLENTATLFQIPICSVPSSSTYDSRLNCENATSAVYKVHYITKTLKNSNFFVNKGSWYLDTVTDVKSHGDNKTKAINNTASMKSTDSSLITLLGQKFNTFPIALNTPRNYYQYTYSFKDLGHFADGTTGRIMGSSTKSLVKTNSRTCFYEVVEDFCTCCGDPILFYAYNQGKIDMTDLQISHFNPSKNVANDGKNSSLNLTSSTVSLYDMNVNNNNNLGSNWASQDLFMFEGTYTYKTNKGSELYQYVTKKGETIYDTSKNNPDYSYTLNAKTLADIKYYNGTHRYGFTNSSVKKIGSKICFDAGATNCTSTDEPGYFHLSSKFLEETFMKNAVTPAYRTKVKNYSNGASNCVILESEIQSQLDNKKRCRWVDVKVRAGSKYVNLALK